MNIDTQKMGKLTEEVLIEAHQRYTKASPFKICNAADLNPEKKEKCIMDIKAKHRAEKAKRNAKK